VDTIVKGPDAASRPRLVALYGRWHARPDYGRLYGEPSGDPCRATADLADAAADIEAGLLATAILD
jgi:hypothetical protein